jgi:hypothetical protein
MLLGVDDLDQLEAYPRGKMRLHNAWPHGKGVLWGFNVELQKARGELQVDPGLALDALGHELHLDVASCVNFGAWYEAHKADFDPPVTPNADGSVTFDFHVVVRFKACMTRQVPAITDPCASGTQDTAYSRAFETVDLFLRPNISTAKPLPYPRLRRLFGFGDTVNTQEDAEIDAKVAAIVALPLNQQPKEYLTAFREYAARDTIALSPAAAADGSITLFPENDTSELLLADVTGITLVPAVGATPPWSLSTTAADPIIVTKVRPSHVATATIQELLNGPQWGLGSGGTGGGGSSGGGSGGGAVMDAGGPRVVRASVQLKGKKTITFSVLGKLVAATVDVGGFEITTFDDDDGWANLEIKKAAVDAAGSNVTLDLKEAPGGTIVRLIVRGTGPTPVMGIVGADRIPLAGASGAGEPPGTKDNGNDFIATLKVGS